MRVLLILLITTIPIFSQVTVNKKIIETNKSLNNEPLSLQARMEIIEESFCDKTLPILNLRLIYNNTGEGNILLYKNMLTTQSKLKEIGGEGKEFKYPPLVGTLMYRLPDKQKSKNKPKIEIKQYFIILAPGESYEIDNFYESLPYLFPLENTL